MILAENRRLEEAVGIHEACYGLLRWLTSAVDRGFIRSASAHEYMTESEAAAVWIAEHCANIPPPYRPLSRDAAALERFAAYFVSFLRTSFAFDQVPRARLVSTCGCGCAFCSYLAQGPRLRPKRLQATDKRRAEKRKRVCLEELACRLGVRLTETMSARLAMDATIAADLALVAYGLDLVRRCSGSSGVGPAALALWRQVAWDSGRPRRGFKLAPEAIREAEARLVSRIRAEGEE
jgi:hypothetical protein